jgi:hypothetical protein
MLVTETIFGIAIAVKKWICLGGVTDGNFIIKYSESISAELIPGIEGILDD